MSEKKVPMPVKIEEVEQGCVLYNVDPIVMKYHYEVDYIHSYAQDSPFFEGLTKGELKGSKCTKCGGTFATPRSHCMTCGAETEWMQLPLTGKVHTLSLIHISEPTRLGMISYAVFCLKKKK